MSKNAGEKTHDRIINIDVGMNCLINCFADGQTCKSCGKIYVSCLLNEILIDSTNAYSWRLIEILLGVKSAAYLRLMLFDWIILTELDTTSSSFDKETKLIFAVDPLVLEPSEKYEKNAYVTAVAYDLFYRLLQFKIYPWVSGNLTNVQFYWYALRRGW